MNLDISAHQRQLEDFVAASARGAPRLSMGARG